MLNIRCPASVADEIKQDRDYFQTRFDASKGTKLTVNHLMPKNYLGSLSCVNIAHVVICSGKYRRKQTLSSLLLPA